MPAPEPVPIACTLDLQAMAPRLAEISQLNREHLRAHSLDGRTLRLTYDIVAADRVAHTVDLERVCCAFLDFELDVSPSGVELTITGPDQEGTDAGWLFAQFLPGANLSVATVREAGECACCRG